MNKEDQFIKHFLENEPLIKAPHNFTSQVMDSVLKQKTELSRSQHEDWLYTLVAAAAGTIGFVVYFILDKEFLFHYLTSIQKNLLHFYTSSLAQFHFFAFPDDLSISPFWVGVVLIPVVLLVIDRLVTTKTMKTNLFFIG